MRSEPFDQIAINDGGEDATWQRDERPIARGFSAVDLLLSEEGYTPLDPTNDGIGMEIFIIFMFYFIQKRYAF